VQKTVALLLVLAVLGPIPLSRFMQASASLNARLANSRRNRTPQITYPVRGLF
jgi:hypothetical protein